jgi:hypothetical protein
MAALLTRIAVLSESFSIKLCGGRVVYITGNRSLTEMGVGGVEILTCLAASYAPFGCLMVVRLSFRLHSRQSRVYYKIAAKETMK